MRLKNPISRRNLLALAGAAGAGMLEACSKTAPPEQAAGAPTAVEIMARQHGVFNRALSVLEEVKSGMDARMDLPPEVLGGTIEMIRLFTVSFHQQLEEKHIYPVCSATDTMSALTAALRKQHEAAASLVETMKRLYAGFSIKDLERRRTMRSAIHLFCRMYRAHTQREDTILYPMLRRIMPPKSYAELSSIFQRDETTFLGQNGIEDTIRKLTDYENVLGIADLASLTPGAEDLWGQ